MKTAEECGTDQKRPTYHKEAQRIFRTAEGDAEKNWMQFFGLLEVDITGEIINCRRASAFWACAGSDIIDEKLLFIK